MTTWGIWCVVRNGVTGTRSAWMKSHGNVLRWNSVEEANDVAAKAREGSAKHRGPAVITYRVQPMEAAVAASNRYEAEQEPKGE
jgi:hypothetical protein